MRRFACLVTALALVVAAPGCGNKDNQPAAENAEIKIEPGTTMADTDPPPGASLKGVGEAALGGLSKTVGATPEEK